MRRCQLRIRAFKARVRRSAVRRVRRRAVEGDVDMFVDDEERRERSREIQSLCCFLLLFFFCCFLFSRRSFFISRNTKRFEITGQQHLYTPTRFLSTSRTELSSELRPPDPTISENDSDGSPPKLGEDRMLPKMRKRQMHREIEAMRAVAGHRDVALELEEHPGMVGSVRLRVFFLVHNLRSGTDANCCCR